MSARIAAEMCERMKANRSNDMPADPSHIFNVFGHARAARTDQSSRARSGRGETTDSRDPRGRDNPAIDR
ncbi:hypothetical protein CHELA40_10139 [Chelatococcus asaccharovorans]|nr:hypothetical protein CHELA40_10139 [Chelatococcus asaccharovorans]CAH1687294.1 hypothetical protein CHELA17_65469 [Chelatococcus asaccharovorans]